jgi:hypothetical protein
MSQYEDDRDVFNEGNNDNEAEQIKLNIDAISQHSKFGWAMDGYGNRHMTLDGRNVLFVVKAGDCMLDAIDTYLEREAK